MSVQRLPADTGPRVRSIRKLEADYILVDLGAGNSLSVLDFFLMSDGGILVVTPEPTSMENAYRFLKSAFYLLRFGGCHRLKRGTDGRRFDATQLVESIFQSRAPTEAR